MARSGCRKLESHHGAMLPEWSEARKVLLEQGAEGLGVLTLST